MGRNGTSAQTVPVRPEPENGFTSRQDPPNPEPDIQQQLAILACGATRCVGRATTQPTASIHTAYLNKR